MSHFFPDSLSNASKVVPLDYSVVLVHGAHHALGCRLLFDEVGWSLLQTLL